MMEGMPVEDKDLEVHVQWVSESGCQNVESSPTRLQALNYYADAAPNSGRSMPRIRCSFDNVHLTAVK